MAELDTTYKPHEGQQKIHDAREWATTIVLRLARRFGKTRGGLGDLIDAYTDVQNEYRAPDMVPPFHAWIVVPSFPQGRQSWNELMALLPKKMKGEIQQSKQMIWLNDQTGNWGGRAGLLELKSASDPEGLQTVGLDFLWLDEAQDIENEAQEKVWPTRVSAGRLGLTLVTGIPALYAEHWSHRLYLAAERRMKEGKHRRHFAMTATAFENPLLTEAELAVIEEDREVMSNASWERLYLAHFSASAGFFRNIDECIAGDLLMGPIPGQRYASGLDIGLSNDPTVLYILDATTRRVVHRFEWDSTPWPQIRASLEAIHEEWELESIVFDATGLGGKMASDDFDETNLPVVPYTIQGQHRTDLLEMLAGAIERVTISFPPIKPLLRQLRSMQLRKLGASSGGRYQVSVSGGEHDDDVFALALALTACQDAHVASPRGRHLSRSRRYAPTQGDVDGTERRVSNGAKMMRKRRDDRMHQRALQAKVEV